MIRHATSLDTSYIVEFVKQFYPQTPYPAMGEFDHETVTNLTARLIKTGIVLLATHEDELIGILGTHITPFIFNATVQGCVEAIWYVLPEHQRSGIGIELVRRVDTLRKLRGCSFFQMTLVAGVPDTVHKLLIAEGFQPSEFGLTKVN